MSDIYVCIVIVLLYMFFDRRKQAFKVPETGPMVDDSKLADKLISISLFLGKDGEFNDGQVKIGGRRLTVQGRGEYLFNINEFHANVNELQRDKLRQYIEVLYEKSVKAERQQEQDAVRDINVKIDQALQGKL